MSYADMFRKLLAAYPRADGTSWTGPKMEHATAGMVNSAYFSNLLNGRIKQPGLDKLKAIADVMGFPAQLWLEDPAAWGATGPQETLRFTSTSVSFAELLNSLFDAITSAETGELFSPAEIVNRTSGQVTELQVQQMRDGNMENPKIETVLALSEAFGIDFSYWFRRNNGKPLVEDHILDALRNEDSRLILARSSELSKDQKDMLLVLMEQLKENRNL